MRRCKLKKNSIILFVVNLALGKSCGTQHHVQVHRTVARSLSIAIIPLEFISRLNSLTRIICLQMQRKLSRTWQSISKRVERFCCATRMRKHKVGNYGRDLVLVKWLKPRRAVRSGNTTITLQQIFPCKMQSIKLFPFFSNALYLDNRAPLSNYTVRVIDFFLLILTASCQQTILQRSILYLLNVCHS